MLSLKTWFLTWGDGTSRIVVAPTSDDAVYKIGKGFPKTINEIDTTGQTYKIHEILCRMQDNIDELIELIGI